MNYQLSNLGWGGGGKEKKKKKSSLFICQITVSHRWIKWAISLIRKKSMCTLRRLFSVGSRHIQKENIWQRHTLLQNISPAGPIFLHNRAGTGFTLQSTRLLSCSFYSFASPRTRLKELEWREPALTLRFAWERKLESRARGKCPMAGAGRACFRWR